MRTARLAAPALLALVGLWLATPQLRAEQTKATVAHIKLSGNPAEGAPSTDPLLGPLEHTFKDLLTRIRKAKNDPDVKALYLQLDGLGVGWGKLEELTRALQDFRKSGKKVFAYVESGNTKDYLLGLACDDVTMPPAGSLMLVGVRAEITFYKGLFDLIGVKADMLRMGDAKTAAEPFTRKELSPASRKQYELIIGDYYNQEIVGRIVAGRKGKKLTAKKVKKLIDNGPYTAEEAHKLGLIDRVAYVDGVQKAMKEALHADEIALAKDYAKKKANLEIKSIFDIMKLLAPRKPAASSKTKVAVVYLTGPITTGKSQSNPLLGDSVGSTTIVEAIKKADADKTVQAIILRVDSPGGSALASDLIWHAVKECKKPVIASMSDVAGSGGYYVCMSCKKIYAEPGTLTGSIGVLGGKIALGGLFKKVGLTTDVISRGKNAGLLSMTDPFSDSERERLRVLMQDVYDQFVDKALAGRKAAGVKMTREELLKIAGGRVWTGRQAKKNGLIDEVGTFADALAAAKKMASLPADKEVELLELPEKKSFLDSLMESADLTTPAVGAEQKLLRLMPELESKVRAATSLLRLRHDRVWVLMPHHVEMR
jgi:protease-4